MEAVTDATEGRYPDAVGSLVSASKDVARLTRERDEARAALDRVRIVLDGPADPHSWILWNNVDRAICDHDGMSRSGADETPIGDPAKVWLCDNCGREAKS